MNKVQLLSSLDSNMQNGLEKQYESGEFQPHDLAIGKITAYLMARAAFTALEGIEDALSFGEHEELEDRLIAIEQ